MVQTTNLLIQPPLDWGWHQSRRLLMFLCNLIKDDTYSRLKYEPVWIKAQVTLCKAVIMSKPILLWRTTFLMRHISVLRTGFVGYLLRLAG